MKLNYKRTILVGFAFFLISAFWQAYDTVVPLILHNKFEMKELYSGFIMSLDNIFAVVMLPIFGTLSDKVSCKYGRRTPFILFGTIAAASLFVILGFINTLVAFIIILLFTLMSMATFRSPAVALMPDVTIKPLRSKANAIINLMGTAGGILVLVLGMIFKTSGDKYMQYTGYVLAVCGIMVLGLVIFLTTVREKKWADEMEQKTKELGLEEANTNTNEGNRALTKGEMISLLLILASVALWYIGYNSITSKYSVYATNVLFFDFNFTLIIAQAAAVIAYIPVGIIASKIGRRKTILAGIIMLASAFFIGNFITFSTPEIVMYPVFILAGIGWATINVNSFPMVVELAKGGEVGKYTGYYYTASMAAQIVAPILSGLLYGLVGKIVGGGDIGGMRYVFFAFGTIFVALSFVTMFFVKHGDVKAEKQDALSALGGADD